jgi:hypothetical protein
MELPNVKAKKLTPETLRMKATSKHPPAGNPKRRTEPKQSQSLSSGLWQRKSTIIAALAIMAIVVLETGHLVFGQRRILRL